MRTHRKSFKELIKNNKQDLLRDKLAIEKIEKRLEERLANKK